jgi:hypothetical protein
MSATLTLTGPESKLKQVLNFWEEINKDAPTPFGLDEFAQELTRDGRRVVNAVCQSSAESKRFYQNQLFDLLGLGSGNEVWGVLGGIGRLWAKTSSQPNPFIRKWDASRGSGYYDVPLELAQELLDALAGYELLDRLAEFDTPPLPTADDNTGGAREE